MRRCRSFSVTLMSLKGLGPIPPETWLARAVLWGAGASYGATLVRSTMLWGGLVGRTRFCAIGRLVEDARARFHHRRLVGRALERSAVARLVRSVRASVSI